MDHRGRPRSIGLNRIAGTQVRAPRAPLPLYVEQEAREGEEWERELPRQRAPICAPPESEELPENVMTPGALPSSFSSFAGGKQGLEAENRAYQGKKLGKG
ncbi:Hypothetical predicted protein [Marmota monax]|uniref:Uncharacterized protein n=1 Tax=Marmota monax TaxID=9995 RepID=A0A5E4CLU9_MARMO|nr:hypothetical protein GHT09_015730 [Marmota monax]VTJ82808.1 Hypothetical predicted protein [Marmota monax]